ncbi:MAG: hypothetical protein WAX04_05190, partial [Oscillospiraceae bacterium]
FSFCILLWLGFFSSSALAAESDFYFKNIQLNELTKFSYENILKRDYALGDEFINDKSFVSIKLSKKEPQIYEAILNDLISERGYNIVKSNGVTKILKAVHNVNFVNNTDSPSQETLLKNEKLIADKSINEELNTTQIVEPLEKPSTFFYKFKNRDIAYFKSLINASIDQKNYSFQSFDNDIDSFSFRGSTEQIIELQSLLSKIDLPENQVQIDAMMYEVNKVQKNETAFSIAINLLSNALSLKLPALALNNVINLQSKNINAVFSALNSDSRFNIVSSPSIFVKDRNQGSINVGQRIPVLGKIFFDQQGNRQQSIEYVQTGVSLNIKPRITAQNIELTLAHQISTAVLNDTGLNNVPKFLNREFNTVINSKDDDLILIGGLTEKRISDSSSHIPFLPFLKNSKSNDANESEMLLLLNVKRI